MTPSVAKTCRFEESCCLDGSAALLSPPTWPQVTHGCGGLALAGTRRLQVQFQAWCLSVWKSHGVALSLDCGFLTMSKSMWREFKTLYCVCESMTGCFSMWPCKEVKTPPLPHDSWAPADPECRRKGIEKWQTPFGNKTLIRKMHKRCWGVIY